MEPIVKLLTIPSLLAFLALEAGAQNTWVIQNPRPTAENLNSTYFTNGSSGWAVGSGGTILHTSNGGSSWSAQASGVNLTLNSVDFIDANTGWAVGDTGGIIRTVNGGTTWSR